MGSYEKFLNNRKIVFTNCGSNPCSDRAVILYQKITQWIPPVPAQWKEYARVAPGTTIEFDCDGPMKFEVPDRAFRSASDVGGGFDMHFDGVWAMVRNAAESAPSTAAE